MDCHLVDIHTSSQKLLEGQNLKFETDDVTIFAYFGKGGK